MWQGLNPSFQCTAPWMLWLFVHHFWQLSLQRNPKGKTKILHPQKPILTLLSWKHPVESVKIEQGFLIFKKLHPVLLQKLLFELQVTSKEPQGFKIHLPRYLMCLLTQNWIPHRYMLLSVGSGFNSMDKTSSDGFFCNFSWLCTLSVILLLQVGWIPSYDSCYFPFYP